MKLTSSDGPQRRLNYFTPLRYPGGKGKLAAYIKGILRTNAMLDGEYAEPYCGGAGVALELLFHEYVSKIHINDLSRPVYAFWKSVLDHTEELCRLIRNTRLSMQSWDQQKRIFSNPRTAGDVELGFATFFLNRTNRSGILNGGVIGGRDQTGPWKIDARFNKEELIYRVQAIAKLRTRIRLTRMDALKFLARHGPGWPAKTLVYLDPPYYEKGRDLYYDFYEPEDHEKIHRFLVDEFAERMWIVSYDNVAPIRRTYRGLTLQKYKVGYSARDARQGSEVMFFSKKLRPPREVLSLASLARS